MIEYFKLNLLHLKENFNGTIIETKITIIRLSHLNIPFIVLIVPQSILEAVTIKYILQEYRDLRQIKQPYDTR